MYKAVAIFGLAGLAVASPPAYGETSSAPAAYTSSAPAVYSSAAPSSAAAIPSSSAPAVYGSSSSASPVVYGSSSSAPAVYASSSASAVVYASSSSSAPLPSSTCDCWSTCFESAGVTSEADLCGNTAVNQCIYYTCSPSEDQAYWAWYDSYCPVPSTVASSTSSATWSTVTYATPSASATGDCWSACFASNDVSSEADLCGNDAVSACIFNTCSSDLDKAYWEWYDSYCSATTGTSTCTEVVTPTSPATWTETTPYTATPYTTTYETTTWGPVTSAVTTGVPTAPATWTPATSPVPAPYTAPIWSSPYSYSGVPTAATGTGSWATATPTGYPVVPATGAGVVNKPAGLIAMALAAAAFL